MIGYAFDLAVILAAVVVADRGGYRRGHAVGRDFGNAEARAVYL